MHESFISGCLFDMGEGMREKKRGGGGNHFPGVFWRTIRGDFGRAPGSGTFKYQSFGRVSDPVADTKGGSVGIQIANTPVVLFSFLWKPAKEKQKEICVEILVLIYFFENVWKPLLPFQTDFHWLAKRSHSSLYSSPLLSSHEIPPAFGFGPARICTDPNFWSYTCIFVWSLYFGNGDLSIKQTHWNMTSVDISRRKTAEWICQL